MFERVVATGHTPVAGSLCFDEPGNAVWAATGQGALVAVRLLDGRVSPVGFGYRRPVAALPGHDGLTLAVVERRGRIWLARRDDASRNRARLVADLPGSTLAARRHPDGASVLALTTRRLGGAGAGPTLVACDLADGTLTTLAPAPAGARSFVVDDARRALIVLSAGPGDSRTLTTIGLDDGVVIAEQDDLPAFDALTTSPDPSAPGVIGATAAGELTFVQADGTVGAATDLARPVTGLVRWGSLVLAASGTDLVAVEWGLEPGPLAVDAPLGPLFVNGYARLGLGLAAAGLAPGDVEVTVREGPEAGVISAGVEPPGADGSSPVVLVAGFLPGEYHVEVTERSSGTPLAARRFRVTRGWPDEDVGPPVTVTGGHQPFALMSWGGAGAAAGYVFPAPPVWRVLVVLVSTKDRRWAGTEAAALGAWKDRVVGGADSVRRFYEEVSFQQTTGPAGRPGMTVELVGDRVFGPVDLEEGWGDVFKPKAPGDVDAGWLTKPTGAPILAGAISAHLADQPEGALLLEQADTVSIVVRSGSDAPTPMEPAPPLPTRYVWGHATRTDFWRKTATTFTQGPSPVTVMTDVYPAGVTNPPILEHTLSHEIGHNLGLADLYDAQGDYPAEINARSPARVDLMASSKPLPHFSLGNLIRLGWVDRAWLRRFDFSASPAGGTVRLQATELLTRGGPSAGRVAGIEIPIKDGWSYLFELRSEQSTQLGDQRLEDVNGSTRFVLGTDLRVSGGESARPPILFLPEDVDGDGPVLDADGLDYRDSDVTNPERMHDFGLRVQDLGGPADDSALVDVTYVAAHRPQLQIRPAPGRGDFKSPDISVLGPFGAAVPGVRKGMPNAIEITVHNLGTLAATEVQIHVRWLPFTVSGGDWKALDDPPPFTVPARGITKLVVPWQLPASVKVGDTEAEHFCVRVDIDRYKDPAHPDAEEIVTFDNWAQSNFDTSSVGYGSPSDRVRTVATTNNPLSRTATYEFTVDQSSAWYRVYLGNAWLRLPSGGSGALELAYESLAGDPVAGAEFEHGIERIGSTPNHVAVTSWVRPENTECDTPREWWGVGLDLRAGRRVSIEDPRREGELVTARVRSERDGQGFDVRHGEFHLAAWPEDAPERVVHTVGTIDARGARVLVTGETLNAIAEGRRVLAAAARPPDAQFAAAATPPFALD